VTVDSCGLSWDASVLFGLDQPESLLNQKDPGLIRVESFVDFCLYLFYFPHPLVLVCKPLLHQDLVDLLDTLCATIDLDKLI
jgi:hypothetical protein